MRRIALDGDTVTLDASETWHGRYLLDSQLNLTKIPADDIQPKDTHFGTLAFLAAGLAFTYVGFVLSAWRWQRVSSQHRRRVSSLLSSNHRSSNSSSRRSRGRTNPTSR